MKTKRIIYTSIACVIIAALAYFAWVFPFYEFSTNDYETSLEKLLSVEYLKTLVPLFIIISLATVGIVLVAIVRKALAKADVKYSRFAERRAGRPYGQTPKRRPVVFMIVRWIIMIVFSVMMIWGGLIFGLKMSSISIPVLSCPWNTEQMTESSCYYLSHLNELFELPLKSIALFFITTIGSALLLGRVICGFLCPMGLIQDIMDKIRQKTKIEGIKLNDKMYEALYPIKWFMVLVFIGLCFAGGNFCNFCPAVAVSPILAGISTSLYVSGFMMVLIMMGSFFKRRAFCTICPLGTLIGFTHKISPFRITKDCQSCTECGACYEACPMGIKTMYTERGKADVTHQNCIMCGECVRCCPEDNALSITCAGKKIYTSSRKDIMSGYKHTNEGREK
ncbi:MAG: 4Fe-4S binding protein [Clostridia bacterium]|nr:4Fe-4S binding protein [Clostridia bacterium]